MSVIDTGCNYAGWRIKVMKNRALFFSAVILAAVMASPAHAQVFSPWVTAVGQPDTRDLGRLVATLYENAGAQSDREKAETLWRYLLTDGRFVEPGMFYHIAGWAYEEPLGEVLDPLKLLNSYGFGLCYQDGPLLEALFDAGGFEDARSWFLTGHTVCEVFFDGRYGMLDGDMLGFTTIGNGDPRSLPIAGVRDLEADRNIIMSKLLAPDKADSNKVIYPWYPADVRVEAMGGYAGTFASADDNWLYPFCRYRSGHTMDYLLRPGEKLIRYYQPQSPSLYFLPYKQIDGQWSEFPREISQYSINTEDGPHSQKDEREWATGSLEYTPPLHWQSAFYPDGCDNLSLPEAEGGALGRGDETLPATAVFEMDCPYVLIDGRFEMYAELAEAHHLLIVETSVDRGKSWEAAGQLRGPHAGPWNCAPRVLTVSEHGTRNAVSGTYGYLVRITLAGPAGRVALRNLKLTGIFQLNPRSLPALAKGDNEMVYSPGEAQVRRKVPVELSRLGDFALEVDRLLYSEESSNGLIYPERWKKGAAVFELKAPEGGQLSAIHAGGRFLMLRERIAPEKTTAETRQRKLKGSPSDATATLQWALSPAGPWRELWKYKAPTEWRDGHPEHRLLAWPEVDKSVELPDGTGKAYVRYSLDGMAIDDIRLATGSRPPSKGGALLITHRWSSRNAPRSFSVRLDNPGAKSNYTVNTGPGEVTNLAVEFECLLR
jgi:hypothetical protein